MSLPSDAYHTIAGAATGNYKEKGSKFLAYALPVNDEAAVKRELDRLRQEHHTSRHVCFAFVLGADGAHYRASDAGEPSNSAGKPILNQIQSRGLTQVLVVVVRYFGGTKLGVSGLINAYRTAAAEALEAAGVKECHRETEWELHFDYTAMNDVMQLTRQLEMRVLDQAFETRCRMAVAVRLSRTDQARNALGKIRNLEVRFSTPSP